MNVARWARLTCLGASMLGLSHLAAMAQTVVPFSIIGHIQTFTLDAPGNVFTPAHMVVNGITVAIPRNTVVIMPAAYLTPQQLFLDPDAVGFPTGAPRPKSGLALDDRVLLTDPPLAAFEAAIDGNIVGGIYIAGQVHISQQSLNISSGYIRAIDFGLPPPPSAPGAPRNPPARAAEMCVGASSAPLAPGAPCVAPDARVRINDPTGVYGGNNDLHDQRFAVDPENPTIHAITGYPMCLPNVAPPTVDANCPITNRPSDLAGALLTTFVTSGPDIPPSTLPPANISLIKSCAPACDATKMAPFMVGDFITFQGTLLNDGLLPHPYYISAHTIEANVGIYTEKGVDPAYMSMEKTLVGTNGPFVTGACAAALECKTKIKVVGFATDPTRIAQVRVYALDIDPAGIRRTRFLGALQKVQAPFGRFRLETRVTPGLLPPGLGATRELMVRFDPTIVADGTLVALGLTPGRYIAPVGEYLFPESIVLGNPPPRMNFQCLAFLTAGWNTGTGGVSPGQLTPWPDAITPLASAAGVSCTT